MIISHHRTPQSAKGLVTVARVTGVEGSFLDAVKLQNWFAINLEFCNGSTKYGHGGFADVPNIIKKKD